MQYGSGRQSPAEAEDFCANRSPYFALYLRDHDETERIQKKFTKRLQVCQNMPYSDRLKLLDLESLELRRLYADLIICYKIVFGLVNLHMHDFFALSTVTHTRGNSYKLFEKRHHHTRRIRLSFFVSVS